RGGSPEVEEDPVADQHARAAVVQAYLERLRRHEAPRAQDQLGAARLEEVQMGGDLVSDHRALALPYASHVDRDRARREAELRGVVDQIRDLGAPDLVLAREAVDVRASAADPSALHDGSPVAGSSEVPGHVLAALAATEDEDLILFGSRHAQKRSKNHARPRPRAGGAISPCRRAEGSAASRAIGISGRSRTLDGGSETLLV